MANHKMTTSGVGISDDQFKALFEAPKIGVLHVALHWSKRTVVSLKVTKKKCMLHHMVCFFIVKLTKCGSQAAVI